MNTQNESKQTLNLAKLWNEILGENEQPAAKLNESIAEKEPSYFNIENYAHRLDLMMLNHRPSTKSGPGNSHEIESIIRECEKVVRNNSKLNSYLLKEEEKASCYFKSERKIANISIRDNAHIEIIDDIISAKEPTKNKILPVKISDKKPEIIQSEKSKNEIPDSNNQTVFSFDSQFSFEEALENFNSIKNNLLDNNLEDLKAALIDISAKSSQQLVKLVSMNLINFETFLDIDEMKANERTRKLVLKESHLSILMSSLIEINSTATLLYNVSCIFLKSLLCDYVLLSLYSESNPCKDASKVLSRKIFQVCSSVCKEFPRQFIYSCLMNWIIKINITSDKNSTTIVSTNRLLIEFVIKIIKDCFAETEALTMLTSLLNEFAQLEWYENIYSVVSCLNEKLTNLNNENLSLLLAKMKNDSLNLSKSNLFSKLLLNLLNKCQSMFVVQKQTESAKAVQEADEIMNESNLYGFSQSSEPQPQNSQNVKKAKAAYETGGFTRNANASHLLTNIEFIVANNQTLMKTTLSNMLKSFK
jgi:hypothetical protein